MRFSLIVSTIGRERELKQLLTSLAGQTFQDFEVIIADQSGGNSVVGMLQEFPHRLQLRHCRMDVRGSSRGRNFGWSLAGGEILNFPDDDCTWPPDLLARVSALFDDQPSLDAITTRVETMGRADSTSGPVDRHNLFRRCAEIALFARRDRMGDLRYDELMGVGAGTPWGADEGPDLMLRMLKRGLRIEYCADLCMYHPDPTLRPAQELLARTLTYSRGRGYLLRKHRFPLLVVWHSLLRSLGGGILMLLCGRWGQARVYLYTFWGKLSGYCRAGQPPEQVVSTGLTGGDSSLPPPKTHTAPR